MLQSPVYQEINDLIRRMGRITFAQFMQTCLYSSKGGFYSSEETNINRHFTTSPTSHPVFGSLIARQLEQMWHVLEEPPIFHVIEVGSAGDTLAQSIVRSCYRMNPRFSEALYYIAIDYQPCRVQFPSPFIDFELRTEDEIYPYHNDIGSEIHRVKANGLQAFQNVVGCILYNELIDNFPVHRFAIQNGRIQEVFVTLSDSGLTEVLDEPSSPLIPQRISDLGLSLTEGYRGEINLAIEDWTAQLSKTLSSGFILTIDYGDTASELYSPQNNQGTLVCYNRHAAISDPYQHLGKQDITCQVDFTSLMEIGHQYGLTTVGYTTQNKFLELLGLSSFLNTLQTLGLSPARTELNRIAMMTLVDSEEYGDFKVLAQAKGIELEFDLQGFRVNPT